MTNLIGVILIKLVALLLLGLGSFILFYALLKSDEDPKENKHG